MKYDGKLKLYNFLLEHGYNVPRLKRMEYSFYHGSEWLKYFEITLYRPARGVVYVTREEETEGGERKRVEYSKYVDGVLEYQVLNGKQTVSFGKKICG